MSNVDPKYSYGGGLKKATKIKSKSLSSGCPTELQLAFARFELFALLFQLDNVVGFFPPQ